MNRGFYINKLTIHNFRGYQNEIFTFFKDKESKRGLILLSGSNGYGKTSLLDAIEWCLTGTIIRLKDDFETRNEKKTDKLKKGLIRHNGNQKHVVVSIEATFNGTKVDIIRTFKGADESLAFSPNHTEFLLNGREILQNKTIDSIINEPIAEDFYERYTCSYEKNIKVYEKSRANIYEMFSSFFGGTKDIEAIIRHLEGDKKKKERRGVIHQLDTKVRTELFPEYQKNKEIYEAYLRELNDYLKSEEERQSNQDKSNEYPIDLYYQDESMPGSILESEDVLDEKVNRLKTQKLYLQSIQILKEKSPYKEDIQGLIKQYEQKERLSTFSINLFNPYQILKKDIQNLQGKAWEEIQDKKQKDLIQKNKLVKLSKASPENLKNLKEFDKEIEGLDQEKIKFLQTETNYQEYLKLMAQLDGFNSSDEELNALRLLVDHQNGFKKHKEKGNKECPLCGSRETFSEENTLLSKVAKDILGSIDKKRSELQRSANKLKQAADQGYLTYYNVVLEKIQKKLDHYKELTASHEATKEFKIACDKFRVDFHTVDEHSLQGLKENLEKDLMDNVAFQELEEKALKGITNDNGELFGINTKEGSLMQLEDFKVLKNSLKIRGFNLFLNSINQFIDAFPIHTPLEMIPEKSLSKKISYLTNLIHQLEADKEITQKRKRLELSKASLEESKKIFNKHNNSLEKLKVILKDIKKARTNWDKEIVEEIRLPLQRIYRRINRHTNIQDINLLIEGKTNPMASLTANTNGEEVSATNILSAGQLSVLALAIFLTVSMGQKEKNFKCYFLDDPIQTMDDLNILSFVDLIRTELSSQGSNHFIDQMFFTTCDENLQRLITHKMKSFDVNFTHIHFSSYGRYNILT